MVDPTFPARAKNAGGGFILGGSNYGQGSSREHAALVPLYLGIKAVIAKSFARIHCANLINSGILPLTFTNPEIYDKIEEGDELSMPNVRYEIENGEQVTVINETQAFEFTAECELSERQRAIILAGGALNYAKQQ